MKLSKREKTLAVIVGAAGAIALLTLIWQFGFGGSKTSAQLEASRKDLTGKVETATMELVKAKKAAARLDDWRRRSLPSEVAVARSLYRNWLTEAVNKVGFRNQKIDALPSQGQQGVFEALRYSITAQASLDQLTRFLFDFYQQGYLHKISSLKITPEKSGDLTLAITIEALSMADAASRDKLPTEPGNRLQRNSYDDYRKMIVDRNVFAAYTPPKPKVDPPRVVRDDRPPALPPKFDHLEFTKLTGITKTDEDSIAWIRTMTTGESYYVHEGDELNIASAKVKVLHINHRDIELQIGDAKRTVSLGQNLLAKP